MTDQLVNIQLPPDGQYSVAVDRLLGIELLGVSRLIRTGILPG